MRVPPFFPHPFLFLALLAVLFIPRLSSAEEGGQPDAEVGERDWLEFYYENPEPEKFVRQMKEWSNDGTLGNEHAIPALVAFVSRVIRDNREQLPAWYEALTGLPPAHRQVLHSAMLYSRVSEADAILREKFGENYEEQRVETRRILEMPLDKEGTIDMLWGFFYATGSENAIRRLVTCFRFVDAPDNPGGVDVPKGYVPLYKQLPTFAFHSLVDNARRHPRIVEVLKGLLEKDSSLIKSEKDGVYDILSVLDPKAYPPIDREGRSA